MNIIDSGEDLKMCIKGKCRTGRMSLYNQVGAVGNSYSRKV